MNPPAGAAVAFTEVQRALALFAHGIAGRPLHLQPLSMVGTASRLPPVTPAGVAIRLPAMIDRFAQREHNRGAYRVALLHQIGYLENGSFDLDTGLRRQFATAHRPALLRRVFMALEDLRVDAAVMRQYPGARADLQRAFADALVRRPPWPAGAAAMMVEALLRFSLGATRDALLRDGDDAALREALDLAAPLRQAGASVNDSARAALRIGELLEVSARHLRRRAAPMAGAAAAPSDEAAPAPLAGAALPAAEALDTAADSPDDGQTASVEFRGELPLDLLLSGQRADARAAAPTRRSSTAIDTAESAQHTPDAVAPFDRRGATPRGSSAGDAQVHYVDEWDCHRQVYLKAWCRVVEQRLRGDDFAFIHGVRRRHAELAGQVRRQFALIRPQQWHRVHRTDDGDELDLDAAIRARVEMRAGRGSDERACVRRERALRDVAAVLLLDMSASTDHPVRDSAAPDIPAPALAKSAHADDEPVDYLYGRYDLGRAVVAPPSAPKRRVIDMAKEALALMCDALRQLGDSHAVYGFSGAGRDHVEFNVAKEFDDALGPRTWAALAAMQPRGATRMGAAIRHATHKLARRPARLRVLIIVSDGYPQDQDYGPDPSDESYGLQDSAHALAEAEGAGVAAFCLTIDPAGHDYLRRMCAPQRYQVIDDVRELPQALTQVYRALTSARPA